MVTVGFLSTRFCLQGLSTANRKRGNTEPPGVPATLNISTHWCLFKLSLPLHPAQHPGVTRQKHTPCQKPHHHPPSISFNSSDQPPVLCNTINHHNHHDPAPHSPAQHQAHSAGFRVTPAQGAFQGAGSQQVRGKAVPLASSSIASSFCIGQIATRSSSPSLSSGGMAVQEAPTP